MLVINDKAFIGNIFSWHLGKRGMTVLTASTEAEGLRVVEEHGVDLVIIDADMPPTSGFDILARLRDRYSRDELPIIVVTPVNRKEDLVRALDLGANDFVTKPIDMNVACERVTIQMELMHATKALRESEERYALVLEGTSDGIWDWDLVRDHVFFSSRWKAMLGFADDEIGGSIDEWMNRIHPDDFKRVQAAVFDCVQGIITQFAVEYRILHRDGRYRWCWGRGAVRQNDRGAPCRLAGSQVDLTYRGVHDDLTGLPKREIFLECLADMMMRRRNEASSRFAVHELNIEKFEKINSTFGDHIGDQVLLAFVSKIQEYLSPRDVLARLEGANFVVLQGGGDDDETATSFSRNLLKELNQTFEIFGQRIMLSVLSGIALAEPPFPSPEEILKNAHAALLHARASENRSHEVYRETMRKELEQSYEIEVELHNALKSHELFPVFQPQLNLRTLEICGVETLLRWKHPKMGMVSPSRFIPIAESSGDIIHIGFWVLEEACRQFAQWLKDQNQHFRVSVNLSGHQLRLPNVIDKIVSILNATGMSPHRLVLELTESILMDQSGDTRRLLDRMSALGIHVHIDDFGTGYSSLSYLAHFPIHALKIDASFIRGIIEDPTHVAITTAVISMGHSLGHTVIAEGIETREQLEKLKDLGCDEIQGFLVGKPMSAEDIFQRFQGPRKLRFPEKVSVKGAISPVSTPPKEVL